MPDRPVFDHEVQATSTTVGTTTDEGRGRMFPCEGCGADFEFHIGQQKLKCPYCGFEKAIVLAEDAAIVERDFRAALARLAELREKGATTIADLNEVRCGSCGSNVVFRGTLTSTECAFCGSPIQRDKVHSASNRVPVDGVLPFQVDQQRAKSNLADWVRSRWFAPNEFRKRGVEGRFNGVYLPYWTFDSHTFNRYRGERGEHYYVTVGSGKNRRTERRTRWYPASGQFERFFDDVLVVAAAGLPRKIMINLEPWPLHKCLPFTQQALAGFFAQTYDVELDKGFVDGKQRIDEAIHADVRRRIGGDEQRVHSIQSTYDPITYKHLLLPVWLLAYRYKDKTYRVVVNAGTGEVQGERPYSWVKIMLAVLGGLVAAGVFIGVFAGR